MEESSQDAAHIRSRGQTRAYVGVSLVFLLTLATVPVLKTSKTKSWRLGADQNRKQASAPAWGTPAQQTLGRTGRVASADAIPRRQNQQREHSGVGKVLVRDGAPQAGARTLEPEAGVKTAAENGKTPPNGVNVPAEVIPSLRPSAAGHLDGQQHKPGSRGGEPKVVSTRGAAAATGVGGIPSGNEDVCEKEREHWLHGPLRVCAEGPRFDAEFVTTQLYGRRFNPYKSTGTSQLVVLGQHKSGTSILTRFLMMMGAFAGTIDSLAVGRHNRLKYWEQYDVFGTDGRIMNIVAGQKYPPWVGYGLDWSRLSDASLQPIKDKIRDLVSSLNLHRPWVVKDPRLCWTFPFWKPYLDQPVCVLVHNTNIRKVSLRIALTVAAMTKKPANSADMMTAWESMMVHTLAACRGLPTVVLPSFDPHNNEAMAFVTLLRERLEAAGVTGLVVPDEDELAENVMKHFRLRKNKRKADDASLQPQPTPSQKALINAFQQELNSTNPGPASQTAQRILDQYIQAAATAGVAQQAQALLKLASQRG